MGPLLPSQVSNHCVLSLMMMFLKNWIHWFIIFDPHADSSEARRKKELIYFLDATILYYFYGWDILSIPLEPYFRKRKKFKVLNVPRRNQKSLIFVYIKKSLFLISHHGETPPPFFLLEILRFVPIHLNKKIVIFNELNQESLLFPHKKRNFLPFSCVEN